MEALKCQTDEEARQLGVEWCINQCRELIAHGVPSIHFYTVGATESVRRVAKEILLTVFFKDVIGQTEAKHCLSLVHEGRVPHAICFAEQKVQGNYLWH